MSMSVSYPYPCFIESQWQWIFPHKKFRQSVIQKKQEAQVVLQNLLPIPGVIHEQFREHAFPKLTWQQRW